MVQQMLARGFYQRQLDQDNKNHALEIKIISIIFCALYVVFFLKYGIRSREAKILFFLLSLGGFTYWLIAESYTVIFISFGLAYYFMTILEYLYFEDYINDEWMF